MINNLHPGRKFKLDHRDERSGMAEIYFWELGKRIIAVVVVIASVTPGPLLDPSVFTSIVRTPGRQHC